jgi:ribosomal protein S18 acetylase RimI-like enzyme
MPDTHPIPTIRVATLADDAQLVSLFEAIEAQSVSLAYVRERMSATQGLETCFLAEAKGQAVGLACLRIVASLSGATPHAEITELYVAPNAKEQKIERALLEQAENLARQRGARILTLLTGLKNANAQGMYRALGYQDYALAMRKHL